MKATALPMALLEIEKALATAFILPQRRSRYLSLLESRGGREKWRRQLAHFPHWDTRFVLQIEKADANAILKQLRNAGAPGRCYAFSESDRLDANEMDLSEALIACVGSGMGTILSCIAGRLAFYEAEGPDERFILQR